MGRDALGGDPIQNLLKTMMYEYLNGQSRGGQLIMRPKDRLLRQIKELEKIVNSS